jgi:hypothetical protein
MANKKMNSDQKTEARYLELFYMTPSEVKAKDIAALLEAEKEVKIELWDEMNILELELANEESVDFEPLDYSFTNPSDAAFIKNRNINTIFAVNLKEADLDSVKPCLEKIVEKYSGFVCTDSEDFNPVYVGSAAKKA